MRTFRRQRAAQHALRHHRALGAVSRATTCAKNREHEKTRKPRRDWVRSEPERARFRCYGVTVVDKTSVRFVVLPLLVCTKNDLNDVPSLARPW
jgi:hypothetical protein